MSWDKNTINCSDMDAIIRTLDNNGISYTLSLLGAVKAMGINDEHNGIQSYPIRKLEYKNIVVLEQINRTSDCDLHDYIHAYEFQKGEEPENWKIETVD